MDINEFREMEKKLRLTNLGISNALNVPIETVDKWYIGAQEIPEVVANRLYEMRNKRSEQWKNLSQSI